MNSRPQPQERRIGVGSGVDPSVAGNYDYASEEIERPELHDDLDELVAGDVRFDTYSRQLYATDASAYEVVPIGVVFPRSTDDVAAVMSYCAERTIPVLPRGGGTSLAGQAVNEAVVLDFTRYMDAVLAVDPESQTATAQPGAILGDIDEQLESHGLKFAPDPAWGDKSALGGAIGNNSTGSHSLVYGKTDAYIEACEVVLADGTVARFGDVPIETLRTDADPDGDLRERIFGAVLAVLDDHAEEIERRYPDLKRNVSGYNLDMLIEEAQTGSVNLARLLAGSEGTLAIVTEATVALEPLPETKSIALLTYDSVLDAVSDVERVLDHDPAAVEVMDDVLLDLARNTEEFEDVVGLLPESTDSVLLVEFYADSDADGRRQVADLIDDRVTDTTDHADRLARHALEAHDADRRATFWKMRKSGLPILLSRTTDEKHASFIEDTAIPVEQLSAFVSDVQSILDDHDTFASYYAHAGPGVLHIRPLISTKTIDGVDRMVSIADEITDLVVKYGGSVSGEHGDGRARTQWNKKLYGERLWSVFRELKTAFDPDWLLNPGNICGDLDMTEQLRFDPSYEFDAGFEPSLEWHTENELQGMTELCHGCGGCRGHQSTTGGVMCPTYRASQEEIQSTRGRANMLRAAMSGDLDPDEQFTDEFLHEVMDVCIGCKGCLRDCPSEVDMAKLKAEVEHEHHERHGPSLRDRLFANVETLAAMGSTVAPLSNWATNLPGAKLLAEKTLGIARERELPTFHRESFTDWFEERGLRVSEPNATRKAVLFPDTYTNYTHPETGRAAVRVLEAAGVQLRLPDVKGSGRPPYSKGFIDRARHIARRNVDALAPLIEDGWDIVAIEPSDAVMFQLDYLDLLDDSQTQRLAQNSYGVMEYLDTYDLDASLPAVDADERLVYHGHCHQKATKKDHHAVGVLRRMGYPVEPLDSGCCGMAGSFGYEAEHYSMSKAIAAILYDQIDDVEGTVVAPGTSCRTQLVDHTEEKPPHPIEKTAAVLDRTKES
ncbi:FAD-binding and (Fe-S)-binding domain-containing protein [Halocatena salina]|uniref:D-lactate dehydrogenase (cytochrome) n=1 Tax=Halocatena salina TaxID=2934340 RepID=A0A8T9ZYF0_9EURY|nr:FAD-binding oxidoreductase [Halocatena salina]UPM41680.1 FAD-binding protein [Halocatena salina]